jgi:TPR repeat protein
LYSDGQGVPQDDTQSVFWYRKAAEQGDASAQFHIGYLYEKAKVFLKTMRKPIFGLISRLLARWGKSLRRGEMKSRHT